MNTIRLAGAATRRPQIPTPKKICAPAKKLAHLHKRITYITHIYIFGCTGTVKSVNFEQLTYILEDFYHENTHSV